jgi:cytochrome c-type biogenesis protein CcmH/NrfG
MEEGVARGTHAAVGAGKEARLKDAAALLDRLLHVDGPEQPIVQHIKRHLHRTTARHGRAQA